MEDSRQTSSKGTNFVPHPVFWDRLPQEDKTEFVRLRHQLHQYQKPSGKDPRVVTFRKELLSVLQFLERDDKHREERSILCGIAFAGPLICVNTRLLKAFLGRCKSSINGGFQQMGYVAIRTKTKARSCIITVMNSLNSDPALLRQWTVRGASPVAEMCFLSSFPVSMLPEITQSDLNYDRPQVPHKPKENLIKNSNSSKTKNSTKCPQSNLSQIVQKFSMPDPLMIPELINPTDHVMKESLSVEGFQCFDDTDWNYPNAIIDLDYQVPRAVPAIIDLDDDWMQFSNQWASM